MPPRHRRFTAFAAAPPLHTMRRNATLYSSKPLSPPKRVLLSAAATGVTLAFYLYVLLCVAVVLCLLGVLLVIGLILLRFGAARFVGGAILIQLQLLVGLLMSMYVARDRTRRLALGPQEEPALREMVGRIAARVGVPMPAEILLEMNAGAAVMLHGHLRRGRSSLLLGYDLLVTLDQDELEAVVGHEMAHARLMQRGYRGWLLNALQRMMVFVQMSGWAIAEAGKEGAQFYTGRVIRAGAGLLTTALCRVMAALSREDEFAADALAGQIAGNHAFARALLRTSLIGEASARLSTWERTVRVQRGAGLGEWIREQLEKEERESRAERIRRLLDEERAEELSTHPRTLDRLQALGYGPDMELPAAVAPAYQLLTEPDRLGKALLLHQEDVEADAQRKELAKAAASLRREYPAEQRKFNDATWFITLIIGIPAVLLLWSELSHLSELNLVGLLSALGLLALAALPIKVAIDGRYRPLRSLPIPSIRTWQAALDRREVALQWPKEAHDRLISELASRPEAMSKKRPERRGYWVNAACDALAVGDYARARAAGHALVQGESHSLEGLLCLAVGSAYYRAEGESTRSIGTAIQQFGPDPSVCWGMGWLLLLWEDWAGAGKWLLAAAERSPDAATLWSLLGDAERKCGHLHEAVRHLVRARTLEPDEPLHRLPLVEVLLELGRPADAGPDLDWLQSRLPDDPRVLRCALRAALHLGCTDQAEQHREALLAALPEAATWNDVGWAYLEARDLVTAEQWCRKVVEAGHCPESLLALGKIAVDRGEPAEARGWLKRALDLNRPVLPAVRGAVTQLNPVCQLLLELNDPVEDCHAWQTTVRLSPGIERWSHLVVAVQAPTLDAATAALREFYSCLYPGSELPEGPLDWQAMGGSFAGGCLARPGVAACWPDTALW